jgi:hypothetical protein
MRLSTLPLALAALGLTAGPAAAAQTLADTSLSTAAASERVCHERLLPTGTRGVVHQRATTAANGLVQARLRGSDAADWDLAVFDARSRELVAASAHRGTNELAEGFAGPARELVLQACRVDGAAEPAALRALLVPTNVGKVEKVSLVRVLLPTEGAEKALHSLGLDETEHGRDGYQDVVAYGAKDLLKLTRAGLAYTVITDDMAAVTRKALEMGPGPETATLPSGRTSYRRLADYAADLKKLATENPGLVKAFTMPHPSLEGRPIEGVEITKDAENTKDGKPVFLQMGVHHAREWPSGEHAIEFAFDLVNRVKAGDARVNALLDKARVIVVPLINPDGFNLSRESVVDAGQPVVDPGFAYKRRNCRIVDGALPAPGECGLQANRNRGTDPNRNYGGLWGGGGASTSPTGDTYRGAGPFSEPETQNVQALVSSRQVTTLITNHTYSDLVLRPPGIAAQGDTPDEGVYKALGDSMAAENGYTSQKSWQLYDTTGTTEDWSYFATGGLGFTFEIGKAASGPTGLETLAGVGFHPAHPIGVNLEYYGKYPTGGGNRAAYLKALEAAADPALHGVLTGRGPAGGTVEVFKTFLTEATAEDPDSLDGEPIRFRDTLRSSMTIPASGTFTKHVNPSIRPAAEKAEQPDEAWTVTCRDASGAVLGQLDVIVDRGQTVDVSGACRS